VVELMAARLLGGPFVSRFPGVVKGVPSPGFWKGLSIWALEAQDRLENLVTPSADVLHGPRMLRLGAPLGRPNSAPTFLGSNWLATGAADAIFWSPPVAEGDRILEVSFYGEVAVATAWSGQINRVDALAGTNTPIQTTTSTTAAGRTKKTISGLNETVPASTYYLIQWTSGAVNNRVWAVEVKFDKIATP
jgi:hypothetical protein